MKYGSYKLEGVVTSYNKSKMSVILSSNFYNSDSIRFVFSSFHKRGKRSKKKFRYDEVHHTYYQCLFPPKRIF